LEEIHNHYIKVLLESGVLGLAAFLWVLYSIGRVSLFVYRHGREQIFKVVGGTALFALGALTFTAMVQDAFKPVLINELFWIIVGLAMAAYKLEIAEQQGV
jgi:O-antigen ligase